jgi:hypothetical protein
MGAYVMGDSQYIARLLNLASNPTQLIVAQQVAARRLLDYDGEIFPHDGCAITLCILLQEAGITVNDTYQAIALGNVLKTERGWKIISVGEQKEGDIGSTCGSVPHHGYDHIFLVLKALNTDEMIVADNQESEPHFRFASGKGKTPTKFFLRASE